VELCTRAGSREEACKKGNSSVNCCAVLHMHRGGGLRFYRRTKYGHYLNTDFVNRSILQAEINLLELRSRMISKETSFKELKSEAENYKENNARQASLLLSLQTRVRETEEELSVLVASKKQAELTAQAALKENRELKEKLHDKYLNECEESKTESYKMSRKYEELLTQLSEFLDTDIKEKEKPQEHLMSKACEIYKENLALKAQVAALQEDINGHEMESKASRETIMRLVSEVTKEQKKAAGYYEDMEKLSKDLDSAKIARQSLEMDIRNLQDKFKANQKAWEASKQELHSLKKSFSELDGTLKSSKEEARTAQSSLEAFRQQIATLLSSDLLTVIPSEKDILKRVQEINCKEESEERVISQLETQIAKLTETLENQTRSYQEALERNKKAEKQSEAFQDQLKHMEEELLSIDMIQDGLKLEKEKVGTRIILFCIKISKIQTLEQNRRIEELNKSQGKLERMKEKAEKQLNSVKSELNLKERKATEEKERAKNMLEVVSSEMKVLKTTLEELAKRERQLADFREVISRMLGLDLASLALPDYEIITRLEGLIRFHQHHFIPCVCVKDVTRTEDEKIVSHCEQMRFELLYPK
uniref:Coiled-coil domain containing 170 n=1 Tax=Pavo cristatus TaxID=9049 RepID=A0A8C9EKZ0_PAVCR